VAAKHGYTHTHRYSNTKTYRYGYKNVEGRWLELGKKRQENRVEIQKTLIINYETLRPITVG